MRAALPQKKTRRVPEILHLKKILVPVDFSPPSQQAFRYAVKFAQQFCAELTLIHVLSRTRPNIGGLLTIPACSRDELDAAKENLRYLLTSATSVGVASAKSICHVGLPAHEIVGAAKQLDVDLIVIATHGYTGWKHFHVGSTTERVVRAAPCPVFVVREKEHDFV
jgi:nucleotide-binding universal stress UspA family protein